MSGPPGLNRPISTPITPASSCAQCLRPGIVAPDQLGARQQPIANRQIRFVCPCCLHEWNTSRADAEAHGRFLNRLNVSRNTDV